jgi:hypothetical protein
LLQETGAAQGTNPLHLLPMIIAKADFEKRVRMKRVAIKQKALPLFPCSLAMHNDRIASATNRFYLSYKNGNLPHST